MLRRRPSRAFGVIAIVIAGVAALPCKGLAQSQALPTVAKDLNVPTGFVAEKLYDVPRQQGSWVSMAIDAKGQIIASHEGGGLYRIQPSPIGQPKTPTQVEKLNVKLAGAHGLAFAFDSLYAMAGGVVRLRDTTGDGQFDSVKTILPINGRGEHGPHAIVPGAEGQWLYIIAGNGTKLPGWVTRDRVAKPAGKDGYSADGPQGWVMRISADGKQREVFAIGLRNAYGMAMNRDGELFTFDSDNEGFMGLPWYRPTNVYHVVSGADFGWRQGPRTLQPGAPDNLPPLLEVGPGSPAGVAFGTGARFPLKYQRALFASDWSYGRIYAVHLEPHGATYKGTEEVFASGRPLAVADLRIGKDGAMYFVTGGRGTESALYRIRWAGKELDPKPTRQVDDRAAKQRRLRDQLSAYHGKQHDKAIDAAWPHLDSEDRFVRYAARVAVEHQPLSSWKQRALEEKRPRAMLEAMIALARQGTKDDGDAVIDRLSSLNWGKLDTGSAWPCCVLMNWPSAAWECQSANGGNPSSRKSTDITRMKTGRPIARWSSAWLT